MSTDHPLIGKARSADLVRQLEDERRAHLACIEMRNEAEAERDRLRAVLYEITTNGEWIKAAGFADWVISEAVYETARDALNEQLKQTE